MSESHDENGQQGGKDFESINPSPRDLLDITSSQAVLLEAVRRAEVIPRSNLIGRTTLSQQSVHRLSEDLIEKGLLARLPPEIRGPGKPSPRLSLAADGAYGIGITIDSDSVYLTVSNLVGAVLHHESLQADANDPPAVVQKSRRAIQRVIRAHQLPHERIAGIGVSMQGFRRRPGPAFTTPDPLSSWSDLDVPATFDQPLGLPVSVENDATLGAIAELWVGAGLRYQDFAFLSFKYGFGGGLILNGVPYLGHFMNAAEISASYDENELLDRPTVSSLLRMLKQDGIEVSSISTLQRDYDPSWPTIDRWIARVAPRLNQVLRALMAIVDPGAIVFGGQAPADLRKRLIEVANPRAPDRLGRALPSPALLLSDIQEDASSLGAALLPIRTRLFGSNGNTGVER